MFIATVSKVKYPLALVKAYKPIASRSRSRTDKAMGLLRIRKDLNTELISLKSVIRGAVVFEASEDSRESEERMVYDCLDGDLFLRIKEHFPGYTDGI